MHEIIGPLNQARYAGFAAIYTDDGDLVKAMRACPQPIIAAIDGVCAGAQLRSWRRWPRISAWGFYAQQNGVFVHARWFGIGWIWARAILPRIIGQGCVDLLYSGRSMGGEEAERAFLIVFVSQSSLAEAQVYAEMLATGPTFAHVRDDQENAASRMDMGVDQAIDAEAQAQAIWHEDQRFSPCLSCLCE